MLSQLTRPAAIALLAITSSLHVLPTASADTAIRSGSEVIADYKDAVKTDKGKEVRRIQVVYNWDEGATYTYTFDKSGANKAQTQVVYGPPTPTDAEIVEALAIVEAYPDVISIKQRQAGIAIDGGFPFEAPTGVCARPARCLQMFLFDAENVVRQMLVDMRTRSVVDSDYIPPQNREDR
ncbi:MAG: hypothetical protein AB8G18_19815 [Gammaproteobacteria bacterium]